MIGCFYAGYVFGSNQVQEAKSFMNTLKFYPALLRDNYVKNIKQAGIETTPEKYSNSIFGICLILAGFVLLFVTIFHKNFIYPIIAFVVLQIFFYFRLGLKASARIRKMESFFPEVISLMASNLRSGITIDTSFLLSARPEFDPLDKEILEAGKEISTGEEIVFALKSMSERIGSEKISKVILLIISGLKAGGNISDLLEETAKNMREKEVIEKKTASTTLMYVIFIFFAVSVGAPALFGLSSVLVEIVMNLASKMPDLSNIQTNMPFTFAKISLSLNFVIYFSLLFIVVTDFISCFVIGLVSKGEGKTGLRFFIPILAISLTLFFIIRKILAGVLINSLDAFN